MTPAQRAAAAAAATRAAQEAASKKAAQQKTANAIRTASQNRATVPPAAGLLDPTGGANTTKGIGSTPLAPPVGADAAPVRQPFSYVPDSGYNDEVALNKKRYDDTTGNLDKTESTTKFDYGFDDPTNPNSRVTEMKRQFLAKSNGDQVNLNSRGMLFSGANLRAIDRNKRNEDKGSADLRAAYDAALDAIRRARVGAQTDREGADLAAGQNSYNRQLAIYNGS